MAKINTNSIDGLRPLVLDRSKNEAEQIAGWSNDYVKMINTKDTRQFTIQTTPSSIFLAALQKQDAILFEYAREPFLRFLKVKAFWLPENPKFLSLLHDGVGISELVLGYNSEANLVNVETSKVKEIKVNEDFRLKTQAQSKARWKTFSQIPVCGQAVVCDPAQAGRITFGRIPLASSTMACARLQLANRHFLATFNRFTRLVDIQGQSMPVRGAVGWEDGVTWVEPPMNLVQRPGEYLFSVGKHSIECVDWKSGTALQSLSFDESVMLRLVMDKPGATLVVAEKKKLGSVIFLIQEKCSVIKFYDPLSAASKKMTAFKTSGTSIQSSRFEISDSASNDGSFSTTSQTSYSHPTPQSPPHPHPHPHPILKKESRFALMRKTLTRITETSNSFVNERSASRLPRHANTSASGLPCVDLVTKERTRRKSLSMPRLSIGNKTFVEG